MPEANTINRLNALQRVLSQTRDVICDAYGLSKEKAFERIEAFIKENSEHWRSSEPKINYQDPFCRMAYLYMNVAVHASLVELGMRSYKQIRELILSKATESSELRICALGGGPGSELLGVVRFIEELRIEDTTVYLDFALIDKVTEWDESWHALKTGVDEQLKSQYGANRNLWPVSVSRSFLDLDVTLISDFENFATRFSGTHLFILCYLVSELQGMSSELERVVNFLVRRASPNSLYLFIDRDEKWVREIITQIIENNPALSSRGSYQHKGQIEDKLDDLGEWYINIPSLPRQRWLAYFSLAQKSLVTNL